MITSDDGYGLGSEMLGAAKDMFAHASISSSDNYVSKSTLCDLIKSGDVEGLAEILPHFDLRHHVLDTTPALHYCVRENQRGVLDLLISSGAGVDMLDGESRTALHIAVSNQLTDLARVLLESRCRVDILDNFGQHPLHIAVEHENMELCKLLLQFASDVNIVNQYGKTSLHLAIKQGSHDLVEMLLEQGAKSSIADNNGQTAVHIAAKSNNLQLLSLLSTKVETDLNEKDKLGRTPLVWSINNKNMEMLLFLCELGVDTNVPNYFEETPLFASCALYCKFEDDRKILQDIIMVLLEHTTFLDCPNRNGVTPVQLLVKWGIIHLTHLLLLNGADVNQRNQKGESLLYSAVKESDLPLTELLLGFAPSFETDANASLLSIAAYQGDDEILEILLKNGCDFTRKNDLGHSPLHVAASQLNVSTMELLIAYGCDVSNQDCKGNTPLHYLVSKSASLSVFMNLRSKTRTGGRMGI